MSGRFLFQATSAKGTLLSVVKVGFREAGFLWLLSGNEFRKVTVSFVPVAAGGGNRKQSFTASSEKWEAATRYATLIFWPDGRLRINSHSDFMTEE